MNFVLILLLPKILWDLLKEHVLVLSYRCIRNNWNCTNVLFVKCQKDLRYHPYPSYPWILQNVCDTPLYLIFSPPSFWTSFSLLHQFFLWLLQEAAFSSPPTRGHLSHGCQTTLPLGMSVSCMADLSEANQNAFASSSGHHSLSGFSSPPSSPRTMWSG